MVKVINPGNSIERIGEMWAVLSVDKDGEGICGTNVNGQWMALVTADEKIVKKFLIPNARKMAKASGATLRLVKFTTREEVEEFLP